MQSIKFFIGRLLTKIYKIYDYCNNDCYPTYGIGLAPVGLNLKDRKIGSKDFNNLVIENEHRESVINYAKAKGKGYVYLYIPDQNQRNVLYTNQVVSL